GGCDLVGWQWIGQGRRFQPDKHRFHAFRELIELWRDVKSDRALTGGNLDGRTQLLIVLARGRRAVQGIEHQQVSRQVTTPGNAKSGRINHVQKRNLARDRVIDANAYDSVERLLIVDN